MKKLIIKIQENTQPKSCSIFIGKNILSKINQLFNLKDFSQAFIITDENVASIFLTQLQNGLPLPTNHIVLSFGEREKNIETIQLIWKKMLESKADRKTLVINLGGGVISDLGGFAASTFMRGLDFINIPTTLLSQVDASLGGKTGINFGGIKNLIGTFDQPVAVIIDMKTLATLPKREFLSGFAEIIKHGLIKDKKYFKVVTSKHPLKFTQDEMIDIITKSCQIKVEVVSQDSQEKDLRKILNFGHTVGHAIEALSLKTKNPLLHGEAITIGMLAESKMSLLTGLLSKEEFRMIQKALSQTGLPVRNHITNLENIMEKIQRDKKNQKGEINWTLLKGIGNAVFDQKVEKSIMCKALQESIL